MVITEEQMVESLLHQIACYIDEEDTYEIPVGVSARHVHLSQKDAEVLFGAGHDLLHPLRELSQTGQFAAEETVSVAGSRGSFSHVRVLGPLRSQSQVELSQTDCLTLGVQAPIRESGNLAGAGAICLIGPRGAILLKENAIVAKRHIHMTPDDASRFKVKNGQEVSLRSIGVRPLEFSGVTVRIDSSFSLEFHIDTDEANASGLHTGDKVLLVNSVIDRN